jgi:dipeptide/tripeptide permease
MAVPIRVLWSLKVSRIEKISLGIVFAVGIITMVTAIIRSVSLESSAASSGQVSTTWLILVRIKCHRGMACCHCSRTRAEHSAV